MTIMEKVSVVMCTYNGEKYIKDQLDSILSQTYPVFEIIIQDDCSSDLTWSILESYANRYHTIKLYRNKERLNANLNFKTAFLKAEGDYICPSDQDDIWYPNKIESLVNVIGNKLCAFSKSKIRYVNGVYADCVFPKWDNLEQCIWKMCIPGHTCMFHREMLDSIRYSKSLYIAFDFVINLIAYSKKSFIFIDENLQTWCRRENSITSYYIEAPIQENKEIIKERSKLKIFFFSFLSISKTTGVYNYFNGISSFLYHLEGNCSSMGFLCKLLSKQTKFTYLLCGFLCVKYRSLMFPFLEGEKPSIKKRVARISFAFRYPFIWWLNNHNEPYL